MKNIILPICCAAALCMVPALMSGCNSDPKDGSAPGGPPIDVPPGDVTVAAYYFPNWGPVATSEWGSLQRAKPMFDGHKQPKVPAWGYRNENRPEVMQQKIDAAADHGLDVFIFDWYFYDEAQMPGNKYLSSALEEGFLKAPNNDRMKFSLLWCNHDLGDIARGAVTPETFELLTDYVIEHYFKHPSYWLVDGCPYFSIYEVNTFLATFGGDYARAGEAIARFREKVKAAGFPDLHLNGVLFGLGGILSQAVAALGLNSTTSYVWIHHNILPDFPATRYEKAASQYMNSVRNGGGSNGLENGAAGIPVPYHLNISMGWDSSPRCGNVTPGEWLRRRDYPFGAVIVDNTPYLFKKYLAEAKAWTLAKPESERIVVINSWNEYTISTVLISTPTNKPITVGITQFSSFNMIEWQYLFAAALLATIPVIILFMCIEKHLAEGLTSGGVKG